MNKLLLYLATAGLWVLAIHFLYQYTIGYGVAYAIASGIFVWAALLAGIHIELVSPVSPHQDDKKTHQ